MLAEERIHRLAIRLVVIVRRVLEEHFHVAALVVEIVNRAHRGILFRAHVARPVAGRGRHDHGARRHHGRDLDVVGVERAGSGAFSHSAPPCMMQRHHVGRAPKT